MRRRHGLRFLIGSSAHRLIGLSILSGPLAAGAFHRRSCHQGTFQAHLVAMDGGASIDIYQGRFDLPVMTVESP